jgi:hypothetical protein
MKNAKALIAPTHYNEPFGGVTIEALMCGTPTITTDWGGFAENNIHGVTGYRCRTIEQFVWAGKNIDKISRKACREWAVNNFSLERVALMYEEYFESLSKIHDGSGGFYAKNDDRAELDWLVRYYPQDAVKSVPFTVTESVSRVDVPVVSPPDDVPESQPTPPETTEDLIPATPGPYVRSETCTS